MGRKWFDLSGSSCFFCDEIDSNRLPEEFIRDCGIANRTFEESDDFVAVPSVSPISLGHVLVVPKYHATSMMQVNKKY